MDLSPASGNSFLKGSEPIFVYLRKNRNEMEIVVIIFKIIIFVSIINVWFFRFNKKTPWRAKSAGSMEEEFSTYGLSRTTMFLVGGLKVLSAILILASIWLPDLAVSAAGVMAILMLGAIVMHLKVRDTLKKSAPALFFLVLSLLIIFYHQGLF
jgi:hypothetical protein